MIESKRECLPNKPHMGPIEITDTCDECGKSAVEVQELIIGNGACICNECLPATNNPLFVAYREGELQ